MKANSKVVNTDTKLSNLNPKTTPLNSLFAKEVSRSQFIKISMLGLISIFGISSIIHFFTGKHSSITKIVSTTSLSNTPTKYGHRLPNSSAKSNKYRISG
jgi:hypothetical protein